MKTKVVNLVTKELLLKRHLKLEDLSQISLQNSEIEKDEIRNTVDSCIRAEVAKIVKDEKINKPTGINLLIEPVDGKEFTNQELALVTLKVMQKTIEKTGFKSEADLVKAIVIHLAFNNDYVSTNKIIDKFCNVDEGRVLDALEIIESLVGTNIQKSRDSYKFEGKYFDIFMWLDEEIDIQTLNYKELQDILDQQKPISKSRHPLTRVDKDLLRSIIIKHIDKSVQGNVTKFYIAKLLSQKPDVFYRSRSQLEDFVTDMAISGYLKIIPTSDEAKAALEENGPKIIKEKSVETRYLRFNYSVDEKGQDLFLKKASKIAEISYS